MQIGSMLERGYGGGQHRVEIGSAGCCRIESGKGCAADAFCVSVVGVDNTLLDDKTAVADRSHCGPDLERLFEIGRLVEIAVDIDNDRADVADGHGALGNGVDVGYFCQIHV